MKYLMTLFAFVMLFNACNTSKETTEAQDVRETQEEKITFTMRMERTPCFGACPTDVLIIENRNLTYRGIRHVDRMGTYTAKLTPEQLELLRAKFEELNFFELEDEYDASVSDLPSVITEVTIGDRYKKVINRYMGPEELKSFELWVFQYIENLSWTKVETNQ